jgi:hypothetical protein
MFKNLSSKILDFQREIGKIPKNERNPFFNSNYADINTYIEVVKPILSKHGLVLLQPLTFVGERFALTTILADAETGEETSFTTFLPDNPDPQKMGAIITYFRRYAIQSILCLQAEDTDANSTAKPAVKPEPRRIPVDVPFQSIQKTAGETCQECGVGIYKKSQDTGKIYCSERCWLGKK